MSLDFYLQGEPRQEPCCECGQMRTVRDDDLFDKNITHNLNKMADAAGLYEVLWRPDEHGYKHAHQIIEKLERGLKSLEDQPEVYRAYNSPNGWGTYDYFVEFVREVLQACRENPNATIKVSR